MTERVGNHRSEPSGPVKTRKVNVGGKPFSSRNPVTIGAIGLVIIGILLWAAFNASKLPIIGGGTTYTAYFTEDAGLRPNDDVRIAGVKVGTVSSIGLYTGQCGTPQAAPAPPTCVRVKFKVKNAFVGSESHVAIAIKTLLGAKYLSIDSQGATKQKAGTPILLDRTTSPEDIYPTFTQLTQTIDTIDTQNMAKAFEVLAQDFSSTPATVKPVLTGLSRLSNTIASRNDALRALLAEANKVTGTLAQRSSNIQQLLSDGANLLQVLNDRRDAIHSLLVNTSTLAAQLEGLVQDNQKTIGPMLANLNGVLTLLKNNQDNLDRSLELMAPFYRVFANALGNGRWFDNYICNLGVGGILDSALNGFGGAGCQG
jgi:phospholipid/cholesterol/gamma-HCH transport system substrate-binding protein